MRCVERTLEYMDGLVFVALFRARSIDAVLFDENFVRLNWFEVLAYGGFRIMVPTQDLQAAREILIEFRSGALERDEEEMDRSTCPACHAHSGEFDNRQRRWIFVAYLAFGLATDFLSLLLDDSVVPYFVFTSAFMVATSIPCLLRFVANNRLRCSQCAHAWHEWPRVPFAQQQRDSENALNMQMS